MQNHLSQQYASHAITETEMRQDSGRDPITDEEREDMYFERVEARLAIINASDEDYPEDEITKVSTTTQGNTTTKTTTKLAPGGNPAQRSGANQNQPTNQSGRLAASPRIAKNDEVVDCMFSTYDATKENVIDTYLDYIKGDEFSTRSIVKIRNSIFGLTKRSMQDILSLRDDTEFVSVKVNNLMDQIVERIVPIFKIENSYEGVSKINSIFETSKHKLSGLCTLVSKGEVDG